jgi:hypothetical protein
MYPVFENNQVLTSSQLNELSTYLDQQTRLTRSKLIGIGIPCGLKQNFDIVTSKLTITGGSGITSEGFLIETGDCEFTQYRSYTLPATLPYFPYINQVTNTQVTLWELLRADYVPLPSETVAPLDYNFVNGLTPDDKKLVMLFLEEVDIDLDACLGKGCDTAGKERRFTLRKLLVSEKDYQTILDNTGNYDLTFAGKFELKDILSQRPLFDPLLNHSKDYFAFSQNFRDAAQSVYKRSPNPLDFSDLMNLLRQSYVVFEPLFQDIYNNTNPFASGQIPNQNLWNQVLDGVNDPVTGPSYFGIQYLYDFFRDLILAYDEFRDVAFELMSDCCFDQRLFPMHLTLGEAIPLDPDKPSVYRHDFVGIPLTPGQRFAKDKLICYFHRMVLMVRMFDITRIHNPPVASLPPNFITPSNEKQAPLSKRSIPYYFKIDDVDPQIGGKLEKFWNFENILLNKDVNGEYPVVAYGNQSNNQTGPIDPIQTPNFYDLDAFNFLRVEGHLRKDVNSVIKDLNTQRNKFDFPFNVVAVRLQGTSNPDDIMERCNFNDLRSQYVAYRNELYCKVQRLFDHYFIGTKEGAPDAVGSETAPIKPAPLWMRQFLQDILSPTSQGNSSASFMPAYYALPGQSVAHLIPPITYSPIPTTQITQSITTNYLPALRDRLIQLSLLLPKQLDDFDYGADTINNPDNSFIGSYIEAVALCNILKAELNQLADQATRSSKNRFTPEQFFIFGQWLNEQLYFLNEFITDCSYNNLAAVYYETQYRIGYLQTNDPTVFSNFITRNPGIMHNAGVPFGGTIVLVYPGKSLNFSIKIKEQLTEMLATIKNKTVRRAELRAFQGRSVQQNAELAQIDSELCALYEEQVLQPITSVTLGGAVSAIPVRQISIDENAVIADFTLPYLTNCNCECDDIPAPTPAQLAIPAIAMPAFYEFFLGDYAFAKDIITNTFGCTTPAQLTIDIRQQINYTTIGMQEPILKLKFVVAGDIQNREIVTQTRSSSVSTTSAKQGNVLINSSSSNYDVFVYTPPKDFLGTDSFEYVFELYDRNNNILLHSNKAKVTIVVTTRCKPATAVTNAVSFDGIVNTA